MQVSTNQTTTVARSEIPLVVAKFLAGRHEESARKPGLVTREDIIRIKLYIKQALSLPRDEAQVVAYVGYHKVDIAGLEPADINALFLAIRQHAIKWPAIETSLKKQSSGVELAAREIINVGGTIIEVIDKMPIIDQLQTLGNFAGKSIENLRYSDIDGNIAQEVMKILDSMKADIVRCKAETAYVKQVVSDFKTELAGGQLSNGAYVHGLEPTVKSKRDLMKRAGFTTDIGSLQSKIDGMEARVEELKRDYDKYVGLCFTGAAGGIIGLAVTGGIFGAKAEEARKAKNVLIGEIEGLRNQVGHKKRLQEAMDSLSLLFYDIGIRMVDAESALGNLEAVWVELLDEIETSQRRFATIDEADSLILFMADFKKLIQPWATIQGLSLSLSEAINTGLNEYKKLYDN